MRWVKRLTSHEPSAIPPMKIAILSRDTTLYSTTRLRDAAEARGHEGHRRGQHHPFE